ncbi:MAG TPA: type II secretion system F family protein [Gemmatimonadaceae bacterium]|nr:type II secretion system F family protein [Gemmatimonadaceae bacterium]
MPSYAYRAVTPQGITRQGQEEAPSPAALERALGARGLITLQVSAAAAEAPARERRWMYSRRADVVEVVRYLATLTGSGIPLDRVLGTVARVAGRADVAAAVATVRARVRAGAHLADALAEQPKIFPRVVVGMTRAGERGGHLSEALARLAEQMEREQGMRSRLVSAMLYPAVMLGVGAVAVAVLLLYVLPHLVSVLQDAGAALPRSTAFLIAAGDFLGQWWPVLLPTFVVALVTLAAYRRSDAGRRATDALLLRVPVIGVLRQQLASARLGRSLATLLRGGLPVLSALDIATDAVVDRVAADEVRRAREDVRAGGRLAAALRRGRAFRFVFLQMVEVGEDGGRLPEMLERGAVAMEQELERGIDRLVRLAEPLMIVSLGGVVGFVAFALLGAIYSVRVGGM